MSFETHGASRHLPILSQNDIEMAQVVEINPELLEKQGIVGFNSRDARSRPFNLLRTQILRKMREKHWRTVAITSGAPNAGKSFVTANLAAAIGQLADAKVLMFDLDLRRASLAERFGVAADRGMRDYLDGSAERLSEIGRHISPLNITLFPSQAASINSAELLVGDKLPALMKACRDLPEDYIALLDLPPVFANDDAMAVMQHVDCYLFVIEEGVTTKAQVNDAMALLDPAECIGTVLNRYQERAGDSFGYSGNYDRYYS